MNDRSHPSLERSRTVTLRMLLALAAAVFGFLVAGCAATMPNGASLEKQNRSAKLMSNAQAPAGREIATLAGGCFWCTEAVFTELKGVESVMPGYAGGRVENPSYEQVCSGTTGHAEAIQIVFDPKEISYHDLLAVFLTTHDPTTLNRQGNDVGTQYRSAIFYDSPEQKAVAEQTIKEVEVQHIWPNPIVTEVTSFTNFYPAEDYHRDYFARNPNQGYCQIIIAPKVAKFRQHYRDKLKR